MSKHSTQFKLKVVNDYLKDGGYLRVANHYGINTTDVRKWVLTHKLHGVSALQKRGYQQYTPQFKLLVLEHMRANKASPRSTSAHFNIASPSTILVWQRLYNEGGIQPCNQNLRDDRPCQSAVRSKHFSPNLQNNSRMKSSY